MDNVTALSSWSAGKDSCLAFFKALRQGYKITHLLNFISRESKRGCFHGIESKLLRLQAELINMPLVQKEVSSDMEKYEEEFKLAVSDLKSSGIKAMVFGDIYLDEHRNWIERVCGDLKIAAVEPLWNAPPAELMREFIELGFKAIIVSCKADIMGKEFLGRDISSELIDELNSMNICPCGENGEYHTFVVDGPIFKRPINILKSKPVLKEGFWKHWFLDIEEYN